MEHCCWGARQSGLFSVAAERFRWKYEESAMTAKTKTRSNRTQRQRRSGKAPAQERPPKASKPSKLDRMVTLLVRPSGATLAELVSATGWQKHSVRGALAGALKKKGHAIVSEKSDGERRYRIEAAGGAGK